MNKHILHKFKLFIDEGLSKVSLEPNFSITPSNRDPQRAPFFLPLTHTKGVEGPNGGGSWH